MEQIIWESLLDYKYRCFVTKLNISQGKMSIVNCQQDNKVVWTGNVEINKSEEKNISQWMNSATFVIDRLNKIKI